MPISNKIVFISGSSRGIGAATALRFARAGYSIVITYQNSEAEAQAVAAECQKLGAPETLVIHLDVSQDTSVSQAAQQTKEKFGGIDVLGNNAGIFKKGPLVNQITADIHDQIAVNLEGVIKLTRDFLPQIRKSVISIGSGIGYVGKKNAAVYAATKWGLRGFTKSLAREMPHLYFYAVHPGLTATQMGDPEGMPPELVSEIIFNAAEGKYHLKNGSDINVKYYVLGPAGKLIYLVKFVIKKILRY